MRFLVQRVSEASVMVDNNITGKIGKGYLVLIGITHTDTISNADFLINKLLNLRVFSDENDKMNLSVNDVKGEILVVSQFTLCGDCKKGTRPSFDKAAHPDIAVKLYEDFVGKIRASGLKTETGKFRAMMDVELVNDGPVTFMVEK